MLFLSSQGQISLSSTSYGSLDKFKPEVFKTFKGTTTIFILSNVFDNSKYEELLKSCWTVTPYKIVSANDFDYNDYLDSKYSFAHLKSIITEESDTFYMKTFVQFHYLKINEILKKIDKYKDDPKKKLSLIRDNFEILGSFSLHNGTEFINLVNDEFKGKGGFKLMRAATKTNVIYNTKEDTDKPSQYKKDLANFVFNKKSFKNYNLGMLKNYLQKINSLLLTEEFNWMYESEKTEEVSNLKTKTLYIPDYNKITYKPGKFADEPKSEKQLTELFEDYKYKYEFISVENLDKKILNNEEVYYLQYVRINNEKFFNIVNGKTGDVVYRDYEAGMGTYNIDHKDFKNLAKAIDK